MCSGACGCGFQGSRKENYSDIFGRYVTENRLTAVRVERLGELGEKGEGIKQRKNKKKNKSHRHITEW